MDEITHSEMKLAFLTYKMECCGNRRLRDLNLAIDKFYSYLRERGIDNPAKITRKLLIEYQYYLYRVKYLTELVVKRKLQALAQYFTYLYHTNLIHTNPFVKLRIIPAPKEENLKKITHYYTFPELINRWTKELKRTGLCFITIRNKIRDINIFIKYIRLKGRTSIYKVTSEDIKGYMEYLMEKGYSRIICVTRVMRLLQFYKYMERALLINKNPAKDINLDKYRETIPEKEKPKKPPTIETWWDKETGQFSNYFMSLGRSIDTLKLYLLALMVFKRYLDTKGIQDIRRLTRKDIIEFQQYLINSVDSKGRPYSNILVHSRMIGVRAFFRYLLMIGRLNCDPSSNIQLIKKGLGLPYNGLSEKEADRLLSIPDTNTPLGIRDRAIMEVLYSTGMRNSELRQLKVKDIDLGDGLVRINNPKGGKEYQRISAIGRLACSYVQKYTNEVRPIYIRDGTDYLFLTRAGRLLLKSQVNDLIKKYLFKSGIKKRITTHSWRVTCATLMLKNDADIRYIQEQLGHRSIVTTQRYTRLVPKDLKKVHSRCHPRERGNNP